MENKAKPDSGTIVRKKQIPMGSNLRQKARAPGSERAILVGPGPVHVAELASCGFSSMHHRSESFECLLRESDVILREALGTRHPVRFLSSSGTGAMEAAIASLAPPGEKILVVSGGKFGDRWAEIARAFGCRVKLLRFPHGAAYDLEMISRVLEKERPQCIAVTHVESSTGVLFPLDEFSRLRAARKAMLMVDAISSFGAEKLEMDEWRVKVVVGASQKALGAPAGVSFVCTARLRKKAPRKGLYYFDLRRYEGADGYAKAPFTPAINTMQIVHSSLSKMRLIGFDAVRLRHKRAARAFYAACKELGLSVFPEAPSAAVQVLGLPGGLDAARLLSSLEKSGFVAAGGQGDLRGKVIRTGFLGLYDSKTLQRLISALANALREQGRTCDEAGAKKKLKSLYREERFLF